VMMIIKEGKEKEREIFVEQDWKKNALPTVMMIIKEGKKGEREREREIFAEQDWKKNALPPKVALVLPTAMVEESSTKKP
jgi:hypothetical protein